MRTPVFLVGIIMLVAGPLLTLLSFSSCFQTILSGNIFACVNDLVFVAFGGVLFVVGIVVSIIGLVLPDPVRYAATGSASMGVPISQSAGMTCKKCGRVYGIGQFFCPSCGQLAA